MNGYEDDKITLIQSALLLGFWYSDLQDRAQSWHWTGVAISLAQAMGLHRDPDSRQLNDTISTRRRRLWRNIWWNCYFRDRWLSFGYGRPLRVNADDCDVPLPVMHECMLDCAKPSAASWSKFVPSDLEDMAPCWMSLLNMSEVLGEILTWNYQPRRLKPNPPDVERLEHRIKVSLVDMQNDQAGSPLAKFYRRYVGLFRE